MYISSPTRHVAALDGMRGIAALAVFCSHIGKITNRIDSSYAYLAVDFFFMLSGFVIAKAYEARLTKNLSVLKFAAIRLRRLYPMIFLGVALGAVILGMRCVIKKDIDIQSVGIAAFYAFLLLPRELAGRPGELYPVNTPHWSLFFELVINFVYAGLIKYLNSYTLIAVCLVSLIGLCYTGISGYSLADLGPRPAVFLQGFLRVTFPFSVGVLLFRFENSRKFKRDFSPLLCAILFSVLMFPLPFSAHNWYWQIAVVGLVFPPLILISVSCPKAVGMWSVMLFWLGELSFPLYATHEPLIRLAANAAWILKWEGHTPIVVILCFATTIAAAIASCLFWDRPVREWLKRA
jgi:peptidoglycan/LPS O-acetylase OafA/YrhL